MKRPFYLDRLAWWIARKVATAILISLLISIVVMQFAGVWTKPPLESTGLIEQTASLARVMDEIPPAERPALASKLTFPTFETRWYPSWNQLPPSFRDKQILGDDNDILAKMAKIIGRRQIRVLGSGSEDADDPPATTSSKSTSAHRYFLAIELSDHSWISFGTDQRSWGIDRSARILLTALSVLLASCLVAAVASRQLARPIQRLAKASEQFGSSSRAAPLQLDGPLEIREAAAAFNAMQERIQQLMESRTEMLMAISHDLRAPLTRMRLRGEFIDDAEQQQKLFRDVDEMRAMIEASLAFFRLHGQEEEVTRFDLGELVHTVLDDFRDLGLSAEWAELPQHITCEGRPLALKRALTNLIENAVKYGTSALVTLRRERKQLVITIDDHGPGVPPGLIPQLFQPFFRGEPSRNRATGGYGLGLPSALSIIRAQGGTLSLDNRTPNGLRATVILPDGAATA